MDTSACIYIYIFFFTYFLANNSKILFLSFHIDSSFSSIRNACPGQRSRIWKGLVEVGETGRSQGGPTIESWSSGEEPVFRWPHVFLSFPVCPSLVRASTRGRRPGSAGGRLWTFEKAARARLAKARANGGTETSLSLLHRSLPSSSNLARSAPSILPAPPSPRARACACSPRTSCIYLETSFREATKISEGVTYSGVKKFGNGDRTDLSDRLVVRNRFDFSFIIFLNRSLRNMLL